MFARLLCLALFSLSLQAQFVCMSAQTSVTSEKVTVVHDAANPTRIVLYRAVVQSTVDGTVTVRVAGTAPTATLLTPSPTIPGGKAAKAKCYTASDVGSGTAVSIAYKLTANVPLQLDMDLIRLNGNGTTKNATISVALDSSGDVKTAAYFTED